MGDIAIRDAAPADAATVAALANQLNRLHGKAGDLFSAVTVRRDMFGDGPGVSVLLAERNGEAVGFAVFQDFYNSDLAAWGLWLTDLYVREATRRQGVGRALFAVVARAATERGAQSVWWGVASANQEARAFYAATGARDGDARILELDGEALSKLAGEAVEKD